MIIALPLRSPADRLNNNLPWRSRANWFAASDSFCRTGRRLHGLLYPVSVTRTADRYRGSIAWRSGRRSRTRYRVMGGF